jgi:multiple sugar transport system permease protein
LSATTPTTLPKQVSAANRFGNRLVPILFLLPASALVTGFLLWPFFRTLFLSFTDYDGSSSPDFVGIDNYRTLFNDRILVDAMVNTVLWVVGTLALPVAMGLLIATISFNLPHASYYRLPFLIPYALSGTAVGVLWEFMLRRRGAVNSLLEALGLERFQHSWLLDTPLNTWSMIVASTWQSVGVSVLLFLVGLQTIPPDPVEAARLDGAEGFRLFRDITFPLLRPMTIVVVGISLVNSLKTFDIIWVMTQGGPYRSSETLAVTMYRETFLLFRHGYGSAIAVFLSVIVLGISYFYLSRTLRSS